MRRASWIAVLVLALGVACQSNALPIKPGPTWTLINQDATRFGSADLRGKVALVTFVYTHCPTVCPLISGQMRTLQDELKQDGAFGHRVMFVSVTVDPKRDDSVRLKEYASKFQADFFGWNWVTGEPAQLEAVWHNFGVVAYIDLTTLNVNASHATHDAENYEVIHTTKTILLDPAGNIRTEYKGSELPVARVAQDIRSLLTVVR